MIRYNDNVYARESTCISCVLSAFLSFSMSFYVVV